MGERNRRHGRDDYREPRRSSEGSYGSDQPWREERRERYPDERYGGGERASRYRADDRGMRDYGGRYRRDEGYSGSYRGEGQRPDYRSDFGPEGREDYRRSRHGHGAGDTGSYQPAPSSGDWDRYPRHDEGWGGDAERGGPRGWSSGSWNRGLTSGGFGSEYGAWSAGASPGPAGFGFGEEERPGRPGFDDSDWAPNRPARGRGTWAGDWSVGRSGDDYGSGTASGRFGGNYGTEWGGDRGTEWRGQDYRGRAPKDYRRSDDRIREEISDRFTDDPMLDPSELTIKVENGEVTLMGTVSSRDQKRRAEELAERTSGVREVLNQLRVSRGETTPGMGQSTTQLASGRGARGGSVQQAGVAADRERER